jgi:hypothetical protein
MNPEISRPLKAQELTPHLALAVALLHTASSVGGVRDTKKLQLFTVLHGDEAVFDDAMTYVSNTTFEQFLKDAQSVLRTQEKLCVLVNVCDVLLADPTSEPDVWVLFQRLSNAWGLSAEDFAPYYKTLVLKNDSSVLGAYDSKAAAGERLTVHVALATSILYALAASGSISAENMGHLRALIGSYEGLQSMALTYIRRVKFNQFLTQAGELLTEPQKIYILIQACNAVLSSGRVEDLEVQMFSTMLSAFGYSERSFRPYFHTIEMKNVKRIDDHQAIAVAPAAKKPRVFEKREIHLGDKTKAPAGSVIATAPQTELHNGLAIGDVGPVINRTMLDNVQEVHGASSPQANIQKIGNETSALNRQTLQGKGLAPNRQALTSALRGGNQQRLAPSEGLHENFQSVGVDRFDDLRVMLPVEDRLKEVDVIIDNLKRKIDLFERKNKKVLREARQAKLSHPPHASDDIAQISTFSTSQESPTSDLQRGPAAERNLDVHHESQHWNLIWISSTAAIVFLTCAMSLRIVLA